MKWSLFEPKAWKALRTVLAQTKQTADANASAVSDLGTDLQQLAATTSNAISSLDREKVDKADIDTIIHSLHAAIFSGEVPAALYSSSGTEMTTDGGMEIYAIKKFKTEGGGA